MTDVLRIPSFDLVIVIDKDEQTVQVLSGLRYVVKPDQVLWFIRWNSSTFLCCSQFFGYSPLTSVDRVEDIILRIRNITYAEAISFLAEHGELA